MAQFMLWVEALREEHVERRRHRRYQRETLRINSIPDLEFVSNYRVSRELFEELCQEIVPLLPRKRKRDSIDPVIKILTALNFYARGSYQGSVSANFDGPMAQQTVSTCLHEVTTAFNASHILRKYIRFPQNTAERTAIKRMFYDKFRIPGVIGCIDCTHIAIVRPAVHEEHFFNRKHFHSLNVQVICDSNCKILNVDASYGGASHDSFIWSQSDIKNHLEGLQGESVYLLGDSGYSLREYMMIPVDDAVENSPESRFNAIQRKARCTIERTFGILKGRWRCLLEARELHYSPEKAGKIVIACCVLHNMCKRAGLEDPELDDIQTEQTRAVVPQALPAASSRALRQGERARAALIQLLENNQCV